MCLDDAKTWTPHLRTSFATDSPFIQTKEPVGSARWRWRSMGTHSRLRLIGQSELVVSSEQSYLLPAGYQQRLPGAAATERRRRLAHRQLCTAKRRPSAAPSNDLCRPAAILVSGAAATTSHYSRLLRHLHRWRRRCQCLWRPLCASRKFLPLLSSGDEHSRNSNGNLVSNSWQYIEGPKERRRSNGACLHWCADSNGVHSAALGPVLCQAQCEEETAHEERRPSDGFIEGRGSDSIANARTSSSPKSSQQRSYAKIACASQNCRADSSCKRPKWNPVVAA